MKKILSVMLIIMVVLSMTGCGVKEKLEKKAGEALAEKIIGGVTGGDVEIDGDEFVIKGEDGEKLVIGSNEWPKGDVAKSIPELKKGKINSVMETNDSVYIGFEDVSKKDYEEYQTIIMKEFSENSYEVKADDNLAYGGTNGKGITVTLNYTEDGALSIAAGKSEEQ